MGVRFLFGTETRMSILAYKNEDKSSSNDVDLFEIAHSMREAGLPDTFISAAVKTALDYEGVADLLKLWRNEDDEIERNEIVADINDLIDDCQPTMKKKYPRIKMNDLDSISKDIRSFKDSLLSIVDKKGGISRLAQLTGIPQPSLSRFFNTNAMPRRTTVLKIAKALQLDEIEINTLWSE
jgi:DNA-binding phage protein